MRKLYLKFRMFVLTSIQSFMGLLGLQIRRLGKGVSTDNGEAEVLRLAGIKVKNIVEFGAADGRDTEALALKFPNARILAIEPVPKSYDKLAAKCSSATNIITVQAAVGELAGATELFIASEPDASSTSVPLKTGSAFDRHMETVQRISVKVVKLDDVCAEYGFDSIDVLKMDAQGSELLAMRGATALLAANAIKRIYTEVQFIKLYENACLFNELWIFLSQHGFYLHGIYGLSHNEHGQLCWGDAIFLHESVRPLKATRRHAESAI